MTWLMVALGAAVGAVARDRTQRRLNSGFPLGTLVINLVGAFVLGLAIGLERHGHISRDVELLIGTGFCGCLTTWSGVMWEWRGLPAKTGIQYLALSLAAGTALAALGLALG